MIAVHQFAPQRSGSGRKSGATALLDLAALNSPFPAKSPALLWPGLLTRCRLVVERRFRSVCMSRALRIDVALPELNLRETRSMPLILATNVRLMTLRSSHSSCIPSLSLSNVAVHRFSQRVHQHAQENPVQLPLLDLSCLPYEFACRFSLNLSRLPCIETVKRWFGLPCITRGMETDNANSYWFIIEDSLNAAHSIIDM